jgi:hypothetical protein
MDTSAFGDCPRLRFLGLMAGLGCAAATLAPGVQEKLSSATFEVVLENPVADPLTYGKSMPLDSMAPAVLAEAVKRR